MMQRNQFLKKNVLLNDAKIEERLSNAIVMFGESISFALMFILIICSAWNFSSVLHV